MMDNRSIKKLEADLWESADLLRAGSKLTSNQYCMPVLGLLLNKFAKNIASDDGVFFTPKSLVKMIVNILEPTNGVLLDPACGSGGMFVQTGDFVNEAGLQANSSMTFYGQEKVEYNAQLCLMNMAVHGLTGVIKSGDEANSFYHDAHNLEGCCNYVMANPPFNVDKVKAESAANAGRLPFGMPKENKNKEIGNANYLWISYFYAYLNETGRAGFVMASSATDSQGGDKDIRERLVKTDKLRNKVLFIDARNYYTVVDRTLNEWSEWQLKNMNAIVWLYRSETDKYNALLEEYKSVLDKMISEAGEDALDVVMDDVFTGGIDIVREHLEMLRESAKNAVEACDKKEKKKLQAAWDERIAFVEEIADVVKEANWLYCKFGEGRYEDIPGLCKIANVEAIEGKGWSLTPGAYVGVAPEEDDGVDFRERMVEIHKELLELQAESNELMNTILRI